MIQTNDLPKFSANVHNDKAILGRIVIVSFPYTDDVTKFPATTRLKNENLKARFNTPEFRTVFIYMLCKQFPLYLQTSNDGILKAYYQDNLSLLTYKNIKSTPMYIPVSPIPPTIDVNLNHDQAYYTANDIIYWWLYISSI